jgi:hypothetical protein
MCSIRNTAHVPRWSLVEGFSTIGSAALVAQTAIFAVCGSSFFTTGRGPSKTRSPATLLRYRPRGKGGARQLTGGVRAIAPRAGVDRDDLVDPLAVDFPYEVLRCCP